MTWRTALFASLAIVAGCQTVQTTQPGAVGVDRKQSMMVSSADMDKGAAAAYQKITTEAGKKGQLNHDAAQTGRVRGIAQRLIPRTAAFRADAPAWKWEVSVITSKEVNAWCMPGGKIAVYTGLIERLKATDDEIAAVMGHEIAHALREHGRERASQAQAQGLLIGVIGAVAGVPQGTLDLTQLAVDLTFNLPNSRPTASASSSRRVRATTRAARSACGRRWASSAVDSRRSSCPRIRHTRPASTISKCIRRR
jgi:Zn-dependent protease with chaperone function